MTADVRRQKGVILNCDVTSQGHAIGADVVVADLAIVRDVHADHQKVARADARRVAFAARAMERHILADQIIVADDELRRLTAKLHVLRLAAQGCMLKDVIARAQSRVSFDDCMRADLTLCADSYVRFDHRVRADARACVQLCARTNNGCRMNLGHACTRWYIKGSDE